MPRGLDGLKVIELAQAVAAPLASRMLADFGADVIGARGVGITPILIDRYNLYPEVTDCPRIHSLTELADYL